MVIEILVAQCQTEHALQDQIQQRVLDLIGFAVVGEASGEAAHDAGSLLQLLQHQRSPVGSDVAPIKAPNQLSSSQVLQGLERLSDWIETSWSRQRSDYQSHTDPDAGRPAKVTSIRKNVLSFPITLR